MNNKCISISVCIPSSDRNLTNVPFFQPPNAEKPEDANESDDEQSDSDRSEKAPLMGSTISLSQVNRKPEIIANIPKVEARDEKDKEVEKDKVIGTQPTKRRSK